MASKTKLIFIHSGGLAHVPRAMLMLRRTLEIIPAITVVPSLSIWHRLHCPISNPSQPAPSTIDISVISDSLRNGEGEPRAIPFSRSEALHIARTHNKLRSKQNPFEYSWKFHPRVTNVIRCSFVQRLTHSSRFKQARR